MPHSLHSTEKLAKRASMHDYFLAWYEGRGGIVQAWMLYLNKKITGQHVVLLTWLEQ
jgi:hypothetical protein